MPPLRGGGGLREISDFVGEEEWSSGALELANAALEQHGCRQVPSLQRKGAQASREAATPARRKEDEAVRGVGEEWS